MTENSVLPIGSITDDGTIYAGISPDTGKPMYVAPTDAPISVNFNAAARYATTLEVGDKIDFRVPTKAELNVLFENREKGALKGTFNTKFGTGEAYWSSGVYYSNDPPLAFVQLFTDGWQGTSNKRAANSLRCVRG